MNNLNSFELVFYFVFDSFLNCVSSVLLLLSLTTSERSEVATGDVLKIFSSLTGEYLCRSRPETLFKRLRQKYFPVIFT